MFSIASILTMAACIFLVGIFYSIVNNVDHIAHKVEQEVPITVFFDEGTTQEQIDAIGEQIRQRPEVQEIVFTSADDAWNEFKDQYFQGSEAAEGFRDDNPLVNSANYAVYMNQIEKQNELSAFIQGLDHVREVNQSEEAAKTLGSFNRLVSYASMAIIAVLLLISVFLISNTVTIGISVRKEEIGIMKLIGATNLFVRAPFLIEGILIGLVGAAIPLGLLYVVYNRVISYVMTEFSVLSNFMAFMPVSAVFRILLPVGLILGMGIGLVGSIFTIRKHLKV